MTLDKSIARFHAGIKNEATRYVYDNILDLFLKFAKIREASALLTVKNSQLQELIEDWVINQR
jgi:hypothetical protein